MEDLTGNPNPNPKMTVVKGENGAERSEPWCQGRGVDVQECPYNSGGENAQIR